MGILYFSIIVLTLLSVKFNKTSLWNDYIDKDQCNVIKGVFVLVVFVKHIVPYITASGYELTSLWDFFYKAFQIFMGQLLVAMFFFYSGYGVSESVKLKGVNYIASIPRRRLLNTILNFDVAVCVFAVLAILLGDKPPLDKVVLSFIGWDSLGNSSWYIFVILVCYIVSFIYYRFDFRNPIASVSVLMLSFVFIMILISQYKSKFWYSTIMCYPAGMIFSLYKEKAEPYIFRHYWIILILSVFIFFSLNTITILGGYRGYFFNLNAVSFAIMIVMFTMKFKVKNRFLYWVGINLFPFYIYQRLPMIFLSNIGERNWIAIYPYTFIVSCLILTVALAYFYKYWRITIK